MNDMLAALKKRAHELENRKEAILLKRIQANTNNPAIAQLDIKIPPNFKIKEDMKKYYSERKQKFSISAKIAKLDYKEYRIEIRGEWNMYTWMEYFIKSFLRDFGPNGKGYPIRVEGFWDKYEEDVENRLYD